MLRALRRKLREIRYHSRRIERNAFDRTQSAGFVLAAFTAPLLTWMMNDTRVVDRAETVASARVYITTDSDVIRATLTDARGGNPESRLIVPLADVTLVECSQWRGWPLTTSVARLADRTEVQLFASARESQRNAITAAGTRVLLATHTPRSEVTLENHLAAWVFASGAWWIMQSFALMLLLAPMRVAHRMYRRGRTHIRQTRINRLHCPSCGYDARESAFRGICPECGGRLYERPEY